MLIFNGNIVNNNNDDSNKYIATNPSTFTYRKTGGEISNKKNPNKLTESNIQFIKSLGFKLKQRQ